MRPCDTFRASSGGNSIGFSSNFNLLKLVISPSASGKRVILLRATARNLSEVMFLIPSGMETMRFLLMSSISREDNWRTCLVSAQCLTLPPNSFYIAVPPPETVSADSIVCSGIANGRIGRSDSVPQSEGCARARVYKSSASRSCTRHSHQLFTSPLCP